MNTKLKLPLKRVENGNKAVEIYRYYLQGRPNVNFYSLVFMTRCPMFGGFWAVDLSAKQPEITNYQAAILAGRNYINQ